ncbi:MAG: hypothetical protein HY067_13735 [Betaproteobacteria bacterium]|nr:hypothetical protein [Betaproteobacteria bacterium]
MPLQEEVLLMVLAVGLYLYDSMMLLYCNEGVLVPAGKGWKVRFGFREPRIRGKELFIPVPWFPHRPMFRLSWRFEGIPPQPGVENWQARRKVPLPMVALVWSTAVALFVMLPLGFFTRLGHGMLLAAVVLLYLSIVSLLAYLWFHRNKMNLSIKQVGKFAFEYLTCPPFALNVVRTLSSIPKVGEDLVTAARRLQDLDGQAKTRQQLILRLDEEIELEEEGTERMAKLQAHRLQLAE